MSDGIRVVHYEQHYQNQLPEAVSDFNVANAEKVNAFHRSIPKYQPTPMANLSELAEKLGVAGIYVKDESFRFGLNAFKVLGGSYCLGRYIAKQLNTDISELPYNVMTSDEVRQKIGDITFVTATDGNHGRGIAWTANRLKQKSVVYMPKGSSQERMSNIRALGSDAKITDLSYDDAVRYASEMAEKNDWVLVQDTSWDGYEKIPRWIMQGYTSMGIEILNQLQGVVPTHIFLQAGVGAMSGAMTGFFRDAFRDNKQPVITIVEPDKADCIYRTAEARDGKLHCVTEEMNTIMAGLACGKPCTIGWNVLKDCADNFVSITDSVAAQGMRILGNSLPGDPKVISGESGAAGFGFVSEVLRRPDLSSLKKELGLNEESIILCISTEGDTDRENYRRIVWDGAYTV